MLILFYVLRSIVITTFYQIHLKNSSSNTIAFTSSHYPIYMSYLSTNSTSSKISAVDLNTNQNNSVNYGSIEPFLIETWIIEKCRNLYSPGGSEEYDVELLNFIDHTSLTNYRDIQLCMNPHFPPKSSVYTDNSLATINMNFALFEICKST